MWSDNAAGRPVQEDAKADVAWRARVAGATWQGAAQVAGYSDAANARRAVTRRYGSVPEVKRQQLRGLWRDRLELLWAQCVRDATNGQPGALTAGVRIVHEAALLDGLHEPTKVEMSSEHTLAVIVAELTGVPVVAGEVVDGIDDEEDD